MRRKNLDIPLGFVISILMMLSATPQALAQCNWSTKVVLGHHTNAQPGLTASGDRLILTWAGSSNGGFNSMISFDGVNWSNHTLRLDFPRIALGHSGRAADPRPSGGLGMTHSPTCGGVYVGWRDTNNSLWATRSADGVNWESPLWIIGSALSAPALRGDDGSLPIGFAFSTYSSTYSGRFEPFKGKFDCDFSNIVFPIQSTFFNPYGPQLQIMPSSPLWTGAGGTNEVSALAEGSQTVVVGTTFIQYQVTGFTPRALYINSSIAWSNNGVAGTVNPNDGIPYFVWNCHPDDGDTCKPESVGKINIFKMVDPFNSDGVHQLCADWSVYNPAVTFFQGKIWIAWRGGGSGQTGYINIASLNPF